MTKINDLKNLILICFCLGAMPLFAQNDSVKLRDNFRFGNGVFLTFESFRQNQPDYQWEELETTMVTNTETLISRVASFRLKEAAQPLDLSTIWGFSIDGFPFIRVDTLIEAGNAALFSGLQVRGNICYFSYDREVTKKVEISAYNPLSGKPFRTAKVARKEAVLIEMMLRFQTGEISELSRQNLLSWISDDQELHRQIIRMSAGEVDLVRALLLYNERNPAWIPAGG